MITYEDLILLFWDEKKIPEPEEIEKTITKIREEGAKQERDRIEKEIDNTDFTTDTEKEREGLKLYLKNKIKNQRGRENEEDMERENKSCLF